MYESPSCHPTITEEEKDALERTTVTESEVNCFFFSILEIYSCLGLFEILFGLLTGFKIIDLIDWNQNFTDYIIAFIDCILDFSYLFLNVINLHLDFAGVVGAVCKISAFLP